MACPHSSAMDRLEMAPEFHLVELVDVCLRTGKAAATKHTGRDNVMVQEAQRHHRRRSCSFHALYLLSQGCPHARDGLPRVAIGADFPAAVDSNAKRIAAGLWNTVRCGSSSSD